MVMMGAWMKIRLRLHPNGLQFFTLFIYIPLRTLHITAVWHFASKQKPILFPRTFDQFNRRYMPAKISVYSPYITAVWHCASKSKNDIHSPHITAV
jgi:hypothetical protein